MMCFLYLKLECIPRPLVCCFAPRIQVLLTTYFGMFVMTLYYGQHLELAPFS
jgi:hypothetical protein